MSVKEKDSVVVDGEVRIAVEVFRACRTLWVRYKHPDGSNCYATEMDWIRWRCGVPEQL